MDISGETTTSKHSYQTIRNKNNNQHTCTLRITDTLQYLNFFMCHNLHIRIICVTVIEDEIREIRLHEFKSFINQQYSEK